MPQKREIRRHRRWRWLFELLLLLEQPQRLQDQLLAVPFEDRAGVLAVGQDALAPGLEPAHEAATLQRSRGAQAEGLERIVVAGGVGANRLLRAEITRRFDGAVYYPRLEFCTDNGAMIAVAGALRCDEAQQANAIMAQARWSLETLSVPEASQPKG